MLNAVITNSAGSRISIETDAQKMQESDSKDSSMSSWIALVLLRQILITLWCVCGWQNSEHLQTHSPLSATLWLWDQGWCSCFSPRSSLAFQPPTGFDSSRSWQSIGWRVKSEIGIFFSQIPSWKALLAWLLSFFLSFFGGGRGYAGSLLLHRLSLVDSRATL